MPRANDTYIEGLNPLLSSLSKLGKAANMELKNASQTIADRHMVPAWKNAAMSIRNQKWGRIMADDIRSGKDRLPFVKIGKKKVSTSGGASSITLRYPTDTGDKGDKPWGEGVMRYGSFAPYVRNDWFKEARKDYIGPALEEWNTALNRVVTKWSVM